MSLHTDIELHALGPETVSGVGAPVDLDEATTARLWLEVTAATGSLAVTIEHSHNGVTWTALGTFTAATAAGAERKSFPGARQFIRARWTITGGPVTFSVSGESVLVYATPEDIKLLGIRTEALGGENAVTDEELDRALEAATDLIDGYVAAGGTETPLSSWGNDFRRAAAIVAAYDIISARVGYNPEADSDDPWRKRFEDIIRWLERIADGGLIVPVEPPADGSVGRVLLATSEEPRGW